ncbi:hypothetical protein NN561_011675 [Cricetulus griseus]
MISPHLSSSAFGSGRWGAVSELCFLLLLLLQPSCRHQKFFYCDYIMENQLAKSIEERTFQYQGSLPSLPVPSLKESLKKYLESDIFKILYFQGSEKVRDIPLPEELVFTVDEKVLNDIYQAKAQHLKGASDLQIAAYTFTSFGKKVTKKEALHPDTFIQLALQLAYYRLHGRWWSVQLAERVGNTSSPAPPTLDPHSCRHFPAAAQGQPRPPPDRSVPRSAIWTGKR